MAGVYTLHNGIVSTKDDRLKEACGVFGLYSNSFVEDIANLMYYGLFALQHRGQESAGMVATYKDKLTFHKGMGLVSEVFSERILNQIEGNISVGHVRYSTTGESNLTNAQPLVVRYKQGTLVLAHNGNLVNTLELRTKLEGEGTIFQTTTDSEVVANLIAKSGEKTTLDALKKAMGQIRGAYAFVISDGESMIGTRDPNGLRPLILGKANGIYILSSESCGIDTIGGEIIRDIEPGEIVVINRDGIQSIRTVKKPKMNICAFEYIYFARPDSVIDQVNVHVSRFNAGKELAKEYPAQGDMVMAVPDSGTSAALGFAQESGIPFGEGLIKNRYVGRTFIKPGQKQRERAVKLKLNPLKCAVEGKRIILIDDSIVRGTTSLRIIKMLRDAGAKEIHLRVSSPPIKYPCYYGIDTPTKGELIGSIKSVNDIKEFIGADSLGYLSIEGLMRSCMGVGGFCTACFEGNYPVDPKGQIEVHENKF